MAFRCAVLSLGIRKPLSPEKTSKTAEGSGVLVLIPTLCANTEGHKTHPVITARMMAKKFFFIVYWLKAECI